MNKAGARIHVTGVVQGVGFRPFVYGLATRLALTGWVRNTSAGVDIEVDGAPQALAEFERALQQDAPPLARVDSISVEARPANGFESFEIGHSEPIAGAFQPISPDVSICPDCLRELFDPADRRYRYPFINCTNCGPRFTIVKDIPYDRPKTTMAPFEMCPDCAAEYGDPLNRRFHAQPIACPACGPQVWLETGGEIVARRDDALGAAQILLRQGKILAIKGLGGFHLACDATNEAAVGELRRRKLRVDKPFALMLVDVDAARAHCFVSDAERELFESRARPIVILGRRPGSTVAAAVAPSQDTIGVMLPYTPLHYLLLAVDSRFKHGPETGVREEKQEGDLEGSNGSSRSSLVLVMTSGNLSEEPIAIENDEGRARLAGLADAFLMHDRGIRTRCDDSVVRVYSASASGNPTGSTRASAGEREPETLYPLRRSRGYAPFPVRMPSEAQPILAVGAELKNTFCITRDRYAFLSHHIGDLENFETLQSFEDGVAHFERLFRIRPRVIAHDLHPDYLATRYAIERGAREGLKLVGVQHHHAHIAACMAEHDLPGDQPVIGVAFDGTGFGQDGAIWGGEFLVADYAGFRRPFHLDYARLPGGDKAVKEPWRFALAWLGKAGEEWDEFLPSVAASTLDARRVIGQQIARGINAPWTSSMGRLFDAAAALAGVRQRVNYEAQAAIEFEALVDPNEESTYECEIGNGIVDPSPMIRALVRDSKAGLGIPTISARFHGGIARMVVDVCERIRADTGLGEVALSGGVWQNMTLLRKSAILLDEAGFRVLVHRQVPTNDGGLALGQASIAAARSGTG